MNWAHIRAEALLPLIIALGLTLAVGAWKAIQLNRQGGSSRVAARRLLAALVLTFPLAFFAAALWHGWPNWKGLAGAALGRGPDLCAMGQLRASGQFFLKQDDVKAAEWFRRAAEAGDASGRLWYARALAAGRGLKADPTQALVWARRAGEQGEADAMVLAGDLLARANASEADSCYRAARLTYEKRLPLPEAFLAIGLLHLRGKGTAQDQREGLAWMYLARSQGLDPFQGAIIQLSEAHLPKAERDLALLRAKELDRTLVAAQR